MKLTVKDEQLLERLFSDKNIDPGLLQPYIRRLAEADEREAGELRDALQVMIWFQMRNREFESEYGMTMDDACFQLIEVGIYQPVLEHIKAVRKLSSGFPSDSETFRFLNAYAAKYLDAMDARDKQS